MGYGLAPAFFTLLFGGHFLDGLCAFVCGLAVGICLLYGGAVHWEQQLLPHRSMQHSGLAALPAAGAPGLRIRRGYCDYRCADGAGARCGADQRHAGDHGQGHHLGPEPDSGRHPGGFGHCPGHGGGAGHRPDALGPLEVDRDGANFFWTMSCPASGPFWPA